jgi:hypothetical protein
MSESEWDASLALQKQYSANAHVEKAGSFVHALFSTENRLGIVRFKENRYFRPTLNVTGFIDSMTQSSHSYVNDLVFLSKTPFIVLFAH